MQDQQVASAVRSFLFRGLRGLKAWMASGDDLRHENLTPEVVDKLCADINAVLGLESKAHPWRMGDAVRRRGRPPKNNPQSAAETVAASDI